MKGSLKKIGPNKYRLVYDLKPVMVDGELRRKQKKLVFNGTKKEAEAMLIALMAETEADVVSSSNMTVEDFLEYWLTAKRNEGKIGYRTKRSYEETVKLHLSIHFGEYKLEELKPNYIQDYYHQALETLSPTTVSYHHRVLKMALKYAVGLQLIKANPAEGVIPPAKGKYESNLLTPEQVKFLLDYTSGQKIHVPIALGVLLGLRRGEACALTWDDIDFVGDQVRVSSSMGRESGSLIIGSTKTKKTRHVALGQYLKKILLEHKTEQEAWDMATGDSRIFVCCWEDGRPLDPSYVTKQFKKALDNSGLGVKSRYHDLRHYFVTNLLEMGMNPKIIAEMTGHSIPADLLEATTFQVYSHVQVSMQREAISFIENKLLN